MTWQVLEKLDEVTALPAQGTFFDQCEATLPELLRLVQKEVKPADAQKAARVAALEAMGKDAAQQAVPPPPPRKQASLLVEPLIDTLPGSSKFSSGDPAREKTASKKNPDAAIT